MNFGEIDSDHAGRIITRLRQPQVTEADESTCEQGIEPDDWTVCKDTLAAIRLDSRMVDRFYRANIATELIRATAASSGFASQEQTSLSLEGIRTFDGSN